MAASEKTLEKQVKSLIGQNKYAAAIRKLQQGLKRNPDQTVSVSEADIRLLQGKYEFEQSQYAQAQTSLQQALDLGLYDDTYYWLAKCLLAQAKPAEALALFQSAFERKTLCKDMGGCYLKLLFLNDRADEVQQLIETQAKRFYAPQLHWARGILVLKPGKYKDALPHFKKMGRPASPGDRPTLWVAYANQQAGDWAKAEKECPSIGPMVVENSFFDTRIIPRNRAEHPATQRLAIAQAAHSNQPLSNYLLLNQPNLPHRDAALVLEMLHLIRTDNFHDAAHAFQQLADDRPKHKPLKAYPALESIHRPLMLLAGSQALPQGEVGCTASFWNIALKQGDFDPNLALNLYQAMELADEDSAAERVVADIISWLKQTAKQQPQDWPKDRLNPTLAKLHCWAADAQMHQGRARDAERSIGIAEKLAPDHPEVLGRNGLRAVGKGKEKEGIALLTQALDAGCQLEEAYGVLIETEEDPDTVKALRRKFGKRFNDISVDTEVEVPVWIEALTFQNYAVMAQFIREEARPSPAVLACRIFLEAAEDEPSSGQKITLNIKKATAQWEKLLPEQSPEAQVESVKAIYMMIQQHAKRNKKGMSALQKSYLKEMAELSAQQVPGADIGYVMLSAIATPDTDRLTPIITPILSRAAQPGNTIARAQLALKPFGFSRPLKTFVEAQLKQDAQNPLLLLAAATAYPHHSAQYQTFHERGFDIARRLQDAEALQAYREEEWFEAQSMTRRAIGPDVGFLNNPGQIDMFAMIKRLAREAFGGEVPPEVLAQMMPDFTAAMAGEFEEEEDDFETIFGSSTRNTPKRKKSSRKRRS